MYVRRLVEEAQLSQNSKTSFRIWGMKAPWPLAGSECCCARRKGLTAEVSLEAIGTEASDLQTSETVASEDSVLRGMSQPISCARCCGADQVSLRLDFRRLNSN